MNNLKLSKPIMVNGNEVKVIAYDFDAMTAQDKLNAGKTYKKAGNVISVQELDSDYHIYIFAEAAKKANEGLDINDVLRMSAKDSAKAEGLVRDFFFLSSEDSSQNNTSEEQ